MKSYVSFTSKFKTLNPIPVEHNQRYTQSENTGQTALLNILRGNYLQNPEFLQQKNEFIIAAEQINLFIANNSRLTTPPLSAPTLRAVDVSFRTLQENLENDYYASHNHIVYSIGKPLIHKLENLLGDTGIALQKKINTIITLSYSATVCSGGLLTGLEEAVSSLSHLKYGIQGAAFRTKTQLIDYFILQHVNTNHPNIDQGNEVHYCNSYFNIVAKKYGLEVRNDPFLFLADRSITDRSIKNCKKMIEEKLNPILLSDKLAQEYIDKIKSLNVPRTHPQNDALIIREENLKQFTDNLNEAKRGHLDNEFGMVPTDSFLFPIENTNNYRLPRKTNLVAAHFLKALKDEQIVNYDDAVTLYTFDNEACIKILGAFLWIDKNGDCEELDTNKIFTIPVREMHLQLSRQLQSPTDVNRILRQLVKYIHENRYIDGINTIPDDWLYDFIHLFQEKKISQRTLVPVMHLAAYFGCHSTLKKLVQQPLLLHTQDAQGQTPLMLAARAEQSQALLDILLAQPFNDTNKTFYEEFVITLAEQRPGKISEILQAAITCEHAHPIINCSRLGYHNGLKELIRLNVDINIQDDRGDTALIKAVDYGNFDILRTLCDNHADGTILNNAHETALIRAIELLKTREACYLTRLPGTVDIPRETGRTPAMLAAWNGQPEILLDLIKAGAQLGLKSQEKKDCLAYAKKSVLAKTVWIVQLATLSHERRVRHLWKSALCGNARDVNALIRMGQTELHAQDPRTGMNALMMAARNCRLNTLIPLIGAHVPVLLPNKEGYTAQRLVPSRHEDAEVAITLLSAAAVSQAAPAENPVSPLMVCATDGSLDAARALLAHSVNLCVDQQDGDGNTALMRAASQGHLGIVTALIDAHASVDIYNNAGLQAIDLATAHAQHDVCDALQEASRRAAPF